MNKKIILLTVGILAICVTGCESGKKNTVSQKTIAVTLSKNEKELANGNPNIGAQLLVRKAVLNEIKQSDMSDKEKFELELIQDNAAINYYLEKILTDSIQINEAMIQQIYDDNKDKFSDLSFDEVHDQIQRLLLNELKNEKLVNYYNQLVEKYDLNTSLKNEFSNNIKSIK